MRLPFLLLRSFDDTDDAGAVSRCVVLLFLVVRAFVVLFVVAIRVAERCLLFATGDSLLRACA